MSNRVDTTTRDNSTCGTGEHAVCGGLDQINSRGRVTWTNRIMTDADAGKADTRRATCRGSVFWLSVKLGTLLAVTKMSLSLIDGKGEDLFCHGNW